MNEEKRMADSYEVCHAVHVGDKEVVFGVDDKADLPFMVGYSLWNDLLCGYQYFEVVGSNDYLEMMEEFTGRVEKQVAMVREERAAVTVPLVKLTADDCLPLQAADNIENQVVVIRPTALRAEYRTADKQLVLATGGFGASGNSRGRAVYTTNLYSGKHSRWNREDVLGIIRPEAMPEWAKTRLAEIQQNQQKRKNQPER